MIFVSSVSSLAACFCVFLILFRVMWEFILRFRIFSNKEYLLGNPPKINDSSQEFVLKQRILARISFQDEGF